MYMKYQGPQREYVKLQIKLRISQDNQIVSAMAEGVYCNGAATDDDEINVSGLQIISSSTSAMHWCF